MTPVMLLLTGALASAPLPGGGVDAAGASPRQLALQRHADMPTSPDLLGQPGERILPLQARPASRRPCSTVFGYLPYWESDENVRYDLLTHIACFGVQVNDTGTLGNDHGWPWTGVINTAHANGVKVILVATLFDSDDLLTLVTTPAYKNAFFANIKAKMVEGSADGVNIDFEGGGAWRSYINAFMAELAAYLHTEVPGSEVTFAGPAVNWGSSWDRPGLAASCDGIFIMGYAFYGGWSSTSGPTSPLTGGSYNITDTLLDQYSEVTQNTPQKLILGLPYYGGHWLTVSEEPRAEAVDYVNSPRFRVAWPESQTYGLRWDAYSQTPWYRYHDGTYWHQVWFDNDVSLGLKYELARSLGLQGVGMWALAYDGALTPLWDELERQFVDTCGTPADFDGDGDVDLDDFAHMQRCLSGTSAYQTDPDCQDAKFDLDQDVDQEDMNAFLACMSGPGVPADPACAN